MTKYNFIAAVIGTGYIGVQHLEALKAIVSEVIVCNVDAVLGKATADKYGCKFYSDYEEMFEKEKLDFISICVPTHLHSKIALCALDHGINVLCEKPFTLTLEEAHKVTESAEKKNLTLMVAHCVRFSKEYEFLKRCIDDKTYGSLISLELHRNGPTPGWSTGNWLFDIEKSGGVTRDAHIHDTDIVQFLLGSPNRVYTKGSHFCCTTLYDYGTDLLVSATASWKKASSYPFCPGYEATFEKAVLSLVGTELLLYTDQGIVKSPHSDTDFPEYLQSDNLIANEIRYFCQCLGSNSRPERCCPDEVCRSLRINLAESESMKNNEITNIGR